MMGLQQRLICRKIILIPSLENQKLPYFYICSLQLLTLLPEILLLFLHASAPTTQQLLPINSSVTDGYESSCIEHMNNEQGILSG